MEALPRDSHVLVFEFLGEPDSAHDNHPAIKAIFKQLYSLCWISQAYAAVFKFWFDNHMDIAFHP